MPAGQSGRELVIVQTGDTIIEKPRDALGQEYVQDAKRAAKRNPCKEISMQPDLIT